MELFPNNAYFNFGSNQRRGEDGQESGGASNIGKWRRSSRRKGGGSRGAASSSADGPMGYDDSDVDDAASIASVSTANSEELQRQANRHHESSKQIGDSSSKRFKPFGFLRGRGKSNSNNSSTQEALTVGSSSVDASQEERAGEVTAGYLAMSTTDSTPPSSVHNIDSEAVEDEEMAYHFNPAARRVQQSDSVVLNIGSPENAFKVQTRTESPEFVNFVATHLDSKKKKKKSTSGNGSSTGKKKGERRVHDKNQTSSDDFRKKKKGLQPCYDRRIKILCIVLGVFVLAAIIAVPVVMVCSGGGGKGGSNSSAKDGDKDSGKETWTPESFGGRLTDSATTTGPPPAQLEPSGEPPLSEPETETEPAAAAAEADDGTFKAKADPSATAVGAKVEEEWLAQTLAEKNIQRNPEWRKCIANPEECYILDLHGLDLVGTIPASIASLKELRKLDLSGNLLTGSIPPSIGDLTKLEQLMLDNNELEGEIPKEIGKLRQLYDLRLHNNHLSGSIPQEIGALQFLEMLSISRNRLTGEIPSSIGNMVSLMGVWLQSNQLSGKIPIEIGSLAKLKYFWVYQNDLEGGVPQVITWLPNLVEFKVDSDVLSNTSEQVLEYLKLKLNCLTC